MEAKLNIEGIKKMLERKDLDSKLRRSLEDKLKVLKDNKTINKND